MPSAAAGEVVVGQGAFEGGVVLLHEVEGGVDADGEVSLLGVLEELGPAGLLGQVEDVLHGVELDHVEVGLLALVDEFRPAGLELVGYELEKDEAEHHVLVLGGLDGAAQLVGGVPEGLLEAFGVLWWGRLGSHLQWGGRRTERVECNTLQGLELFDKNSFRLVMTLMTPTRIEVQAFVPQFGGHETTTGKKRLEMVQAEAKTI